MNQPVKKIPLCDLTRQAALFEPEISAAIAQVFRSGRYIHGPACEEFETAFADYLGVRFAIGCASGSDALLMALLAAGIGPGDEVLVPTYTFFATAEAVSRAGATPVFVDVEPQYLTIDPAALERSLTARTKAVIPVHLFGMPADLNALCEFCDEHGLVLIEDTAQALGATYQGRRLSASRHFGCFSFFPTKILGAIGDGGMVATNDEALAQQVRQLRVHGQSARYVHERIGLNSRLDTLQAAILLAKLPHLDRWLEQRAALAQRYHEGLRPLTGSGQVQCPSAPIYGYPAWGYYVIHVAEQFRNTLQAHLRTEGIGTEIYYPLPLHRQPCYRNLIPEGVNFPVADTASRTTLALPIFPELTPTEQDFTLNRIRDFFANLRT